MASRKRTKEQIERDRMRVSELVLQHYKHHEIADILAEETGLRLSPQQITYDMRKVRDDWLETRRGNYDALINQELARLDALEKELWEAMRKSTEGRVRSTVEETSVGDRVITTKETVAASPSYFAQILAVQQDRRKLLGLYAPQHLKIDKRVVKAYAEISPDDWPAGNDIIPGEFEVRENN